jgi:hypothetical protein
MKNTQGQEYHFEPLNPTTWVLVGEPQLLSVVKNGTVITAPTANVDVVNYSGGLTLGRGNHINGLLITQVNYTNGNIEYVV